MHKAAAAALLAGPAVLAFFTGGYLDDARGWAGLAAWALVVAGLLVGDLPRGRAAALALGGSAAFAAWTLLSTTWAPLSASAWDAGQIALLYTGVLAAAALLLPHVLRLVEPALALGILVVVGYGLAERLLPGVFEFARSVTAQGRLEQPITYWNGMGVLAATGVVLCARLAGDPTRDRRLRAAAAAAAAPLGLGLALTVSRGSLLACAAGLVALVVLSRRREQLAAAAHVASIAALAGLAAQPLEGVTLLRGGDRELHGLIMLAVLAALAAAAALTVHRVDRRAGDLRLPQRSGVLAVSLVGIGVGIAILLGAEERGPRELSADAGRLTTLQSNRYEYWRVAARTWADHPVEGVGAGGWAVEWRKERPFREDANDAHSLYLQTLAELGLVGLLLLGVWFGGVVLAARAGPPGLAAVCAVWGVHVLLDWDFQLPATTLPAMLAAGALIGRAGRAS